MQSAEKYVLDITPNISTLTFTATVQIHLKLTGNTAEVVLHSEKLTIHTATLAHDDYHADCLVTCLEDTAVFAAGSLIPNGAVLTICYSGVHGNDLAGFYVTKDLNGSSALVTQCQPTQCRRIFPCFDQPNRKASFIVTLNIPPHLTGLANMHVESEQLVTVDGNTLKSLKFAPTPLMSTYVSSF
jgi:aminopeptidase N